jgi:hypothetical protein
MSIRLRFALLMIIVVLTLPIVAISAQENPDCNPASVIDSASKLKSTGDTAKDIAALKELSIAISKQNIACNGLKFEGNAAKIIGPFDLPKGMYKTTVTTKGFFIAELKVLDGECGTGSFSNHLYNMMNMELKELSEEAFLESEGCRLIIQTSNVSAPWVLTIEPLE